MALGRHPALFERPAQEVRGLEWALATVEAENIERARACVEEHVAVLRLYQRFRYRYANLDLQAFGLPTRSAVTTRPSMP